MHKGQELVMLKIKDYPPDAEFADVMPRHWQVGSLGFMSWLGTLNYLDIVCESGVYIFETYRELRAGLPDLTTLAGLYNMLQLLTAVRCHHSHCIFMSLCHASLVITEGICCLSKSAACLSNTSLQH